MKIINVNKNDSASISQQTTIKSPLLEKIKKLITDIFSFIRENTQSNRAISKEVNKPLDLSHEISRALEQKNDSKRDINRITFSFKESIYDIPTNNSPISEEPIYAEIYDVPTNNKPVLNEPIYDAPTNNSPISEEPIYAEIYDVPTNNRSVLDQPIYEEINEFSTRFCNKEPMMETPPPLPPRNPVV